MWVCWCPVGAFSHLCCEQNGKCSNMIFERLYHTLSQSACVRVPMCVCFIRAVFKGLEGHWLQWFVQSGTPNAVLQLILPLWRLSVEIQSFDLQWFCHKKLQQRWHFMSWLCKISPSPLPTQDSDHLLCWFESIWVQFWIVLYAVQGFPFIIEGHW